MPNRRDPPCALNVCGTLTQCDALVLPPVRAPLVALIALVALVAFVAPMRATGAQGIPFSTPTAMPLPLAENGIRAFYQHMELQDLLRSGHAVANPENLGMTVDVVPIMIQAAVTPHTIAIVGGQYLHKTLDRKSVV